jgi:phosphoribosylformylglycinamidine synthase subunit PurS
MWKAKIYIRLKDTLSDPEGLAVKQALTSVGFSSVDRVRMGKFILVWIKAANRDSASAEVEDMCKQLLANPVIEDYSFDLTKEDK